MTRLHSMLEARTSESPTPAGCGQKLDRCPRAARQGSRPGQRLFDREDALVERLADHHRRRAGRHQRVEIFQPRHAARGDHRAGGQRPRQPRRRLEVRPRAHAVAPDVGVEHRARARAGDRQADVGGVGRGLLGPALDGDLARARVDRDHQPLRPARAGRLDHGRILHRRGAEDDVPDAQLEEARAVVERSHAAAGLDRNAGRVDDPLQGRLVVDARVGATRERGVEIDDVNPRRARRREARRHLPGGAVVDLGALAAPLLEAHRRAAQQIDGRKDLHVFALTFYAEAKPRRRAKPAAWLFSG